MEKEKKTINLKALLKEITPKWRVNQFSKQKPICSCVAYIDARDVMDILDEAVGQDGWQDVYTSIDNKLFCSIGIKIDGEWVWKQDCGTESNNEQEKGQVSDAFKRAAVKWGVGRFLYSLPIEYLDANEVKKENNSPYPIDKHGKRIYDITEYINNKNKKQ